MNVGELIRDARKKCGFTQVEVANRANIAVNSLRLYEANKRKPKLETHNEIAKAIGTSLVSLLGLDSLDSWSGLRDNWEYRVTWAVSNLNEEGQRKVAEYAEDLAKLRQYQREKAITNP